MRSQSITAFLMLVAAVAVSVLAAAPRITGAQGLIEPDAARAVVRCQKVINKTERTFAGAAFADLQKCLETVLACLQLKPGDAECPTRASALCDKQFLRTDQAAIKLRAAVGKACGAVAVPYGTLRLAEALDIDALIATCAPVGVPGLDSLANYAECLFRIVECRVGDLVIAGAPRAKDLLASIGRDLGRSFCPTPGSTTTFLRTPTPTLTTTPIATATPIPTPTSVTPAPTPSLIPPPTATVTTTATATVAVTLTPTITPTPSLFNVVFVTSTTHSGNLGGLAGADSICTARASAAGLTGSYVAWLSTGTVDALTRLGTARGFVRLDGEPFADQPSDLALNEVWNALHLDETGADVGADVVWTGTLKSGAKAAETCTNWTATSGTGRSGRTQGGPAVWTESVTSPNCTTAHRLYCFGTDHGATERTPNVASGKLAFITNGTLNLANTPGLVGADSMCQSEATAASLPGTYKALLATTTASAISRFAVAASYVRPDGTLIASGATLAAGGILASGIWQRPTGVYLVSFSDVAWTGADTPSILGTTGSTCSDFTSSTGTGFFGRATLGDPTWWRDASTSACAQGHHVYCLQE